MKFLNFPVLFPMLGILLFLIFEVHADEKRSKVICFGDSITNRGYFEVLSDLVGAETVNAGIAGHNSRQGLHRIEKDVLAKEPDLVVVFFGTNDLRVDSDRAHVPVSKYTENLQEMVTRIRKVGAKVVICTLPPIVEEVYFGRHDVAIYEAKGGLEDLIKSYRAAAIAVAKKNEVALVDLNQLLATTPEWLSKDGVHPSPRGNTLIAEHVAKEVGPLLKEESSALPVSPNVILVMSDDQGWGDVGFNGHPDLQTPHLDAMAENGIKFDRFYAASPLCSPTRGSCLTGRFPFRYGILAAHTGGMRTGEITVAEALKDQGYQTGFFGKWHIGWIDPSDVGSRGFYSPPSHHGFDHTFATTSAVPTWDPGVTPKGWNSWGQKEGELWKGGAPYFENGTPVTENMSGDDSRIIMDRVIPFIEENKEQPFFATVWFHAPHEPVVAGPEYRARYAEFDEGRQHYFGCLTAMDEQVGRLRAKLRELEIEKNTLIIFCSDNGPADPLHRKEIASAGPFKGHKHTMYEGGLLVPACVEWPGVIPANQSTNVRCSTVDIFPTVTGVAGYQFKGSKKRPIDGIDLMPVIRGEVEKREKALFFGFRRLHKEIDGKAIISGNYKLLREAKKGGRLRLYDLRKDPHEEQDIAAEQPELVKEMSAQLRALEKSCQLSRDGQDYQY